MHPSRGACHASVGTPEHSAFIGIHRCSSAFIGVRRCHVGPSGGSCPMGQDKNCKQRCSSGTRRSDPCWDEPLALHKGTTGVEIGVPESLAVVRSCKQLHVLGATCSKRFIYSSTAANSFFATCSKTDAPQCVQRGASLHFFQGHLDGPFEVEGADCFIRHASGGRPSETWPRVAM